MTDPRPRPVPLNTTKVLVEGYLAASANHEAMMGRHYKRTTTSLYDTDRDWCRQTAEEDLVLPALVATQRIDAAREHLKGITALLQLPGLDIPASGLARGCCEASARAADVVDPNVTVRDRMSRALSDAAYSLRLVTGSPAARKLVETADRLGIEVQRDKNGRLAGFGSRRRRSMTDLTLDYLGGDVDHPPEDFKVLWNHWNSAAHGGLDAGMAARLGEAMSRMSDSRKAAAASMALYAFATAQDRLWVYMGHPQLAHTLHAHEP